MLPPPGQLRIPVVRNEIQKSETRNHRLILGLNNDTFQVFRLLLIFYIGNESRDDDESKKKRSREQSSKNKSHSVSTTQTHHHHSPTTVIGSDFGQMSPEEENYESHNEKYGTLVSEEIQEPAGVHYPSLTTETCRTSAAGTRCGISSTDTEIIPAAYDSTSYLEASNQYDDNASTSLPCTNVAISSTHSIKAEDDGSFGGEQFESFDSKDLSLVHPSSTCKRIKTSISKSYAETPVGTDNEWDDYQTSEVAVKGKLSCEICHKVFKMAQHYRRHRLSRSGQPKQPFSCEHCDMQFCEKHALKKHMVVHDPFVKLFSCDICLKTFTQKHSLERHILLMHTDHEKTFFCDLCDKSFALKHNLVQHRQTHSRK